MATLLTGDKDEQDLNQIAVAIFANYLRKSEQTFGILQLGNGIWFANATLCGTPSSLGSLKFFNDSLLRELQCIIVVAPFMDSWHRKEIEKIIRARLRHSGWGQKQANRLPLQFWGEQSLREVPLLCLRYFPDYVSDGKNRLKWIHSIRSAYDREIIKLNSAIQFVGMSVYKEEASAGIEIEKIYIPLRVVPEGTSEETTETSTDPLTLLTPGARHVILGDPGSGKSTLLRFLTLAGLKPQLLEKYGSKKDDRLPILITLRRYAEELRSRPDLSLLDHAVETTRADLGIPSLDREFFEYSLCAGQGLVLLDGIDELPDPSLKLTVRGQVANLLRFYPGNTIVATSRIFGYDQEARFDELGFDHYRVAKLTLENIETFVSEWYRARIANRRESDLHARDLVNILQAVDNRAIRELAENPLLLTIICLVHRIDAELPDERVVLYQKCTETLLNTWHNWKFRGERESLQGRNKVERRNRSRMEAIAYWMHASLGDSQEEVQRAVIPSEALRDFLTEYIRDSEKPRYEDPLNMAETFLRFVKERAGLLIEVGSGHNSFLHLTFQEYLTATHLRKTGETAGIATIAPFVANHCGDSKWHEVIRLLVGSLEKADSQRYLLERILPQRGEDRAFDRVLVAGGCLLDGVDAAEEMQEEILSALLFQTSSVKNVDFFRQVLRLLRTWEERDSAHRDMLEKIAKNIGLTVDGVTEEFALGLSLTALGWQEERVFDTTSCLRDESRIEGITYLNLCRSGASSPGWSESEENRLQNFLVAETLASSRSNFNSAILAPIFFSEPAPRFRHLLACVAFSGAFKEFVFNCAVVQGNFQLARARDRAQYRVRTLDRERDRERALALDRTLDWAQVRVRVRVESWDVIRDLDRELDLDLALNEAQNQNVEIWSLLTADEDICGPILDLVCDLLDLSPRPQWWEALRIRALPQVPKRVTLADPQTWRVTQEAFLRNHLSEMDCEHAASQLLLDVWLWMVYHHDRADESPFVELSSLTRSNNSPLLRIAHCIRDIAYGDRFRGADLKAMADSDDPAYRTIFESAFWR